MAEPRWCLEMEIQKTGDNVGFCPLPVTGPVDPIGRCGVVAARVVTKSRPWYARDIASDLAGMNRLDEQNVNSTVTKSSCTGLPLPGKTVNTPPIDFITDVLAVNRVKSDGTVTFRVRCRWTKKDTSLNPELPRLKLQAIKRRDNTPFPPDFVILDTVLTTITSTFTVYTIDVTLPNIVWYTNNRWLARFIGHFERTSSGE